MVLLLSVKIPWMLAREFNAMLNEDEKQGGLRRVSYTCQFIKNFCNDFFLKDIGFQGPLFTWSRGSLFKRLDRALCNYQ